MILAQLAFYSAAALLIIAALYVVTARNPVRGVLSLVVAFIATAVLWILLYAEFLALALVLVYVGAVMTLFLFVVMMLDIHIAPQRARYVRYLPLGMLVFAVLAALMISVLTPEHLQQTEVNAELLAKSADYSNVAALGRVLYTEYLLAFEIAGVILLVAMIAAISLAFRGRRADSKAQDPAAQVAVDPKQRIKLINLSENEQ
jgi:NADH-quinone oxidoreductase subunit J